MLYVSKELRSMILRFLNMLKISSVSAEDKLDSVYREVESERVHKNFVNIIPSSLLLLVVEICGIIYNVFVGSTIKFQIIYIIAFVAFLLCSISILLYINKVLAKNEITDKKKEVICYLYWIVFTLSAVCFSVFEMMDSGTTNHFFICILALTLWPVLEPTLMIPYYCVAIAIETVTIYFSTGQYFSYVFCYLITIIGIVSSYIKYSEYMTRCIESKRLERMAEIDPLTMLMNRRGMQRSVDGIWAYCRSHDIPITIAMLDIDYFKMYNDKFGHSCGDECLKRISLCIKESFSRRTDITCRFGGEEFIIVLAGENEEKSLMSFVNLQNKIEQLEIKSGHPDFNKNVTVSIGVCSKVPDDTLQFKDMVLEADTELYNAKQNGRNCLSFSGELYNNE